jgi:hypothetical protein
MRLFNVGDRFQRMTDEEFRELPFGFAATDADGDLAIIVGPGKYQRVYASSRALPNILSNNTFDGTYGPYTVTKSPYTATTATVPVALLERVLTELARGQQRLGCYGNSCAYSEGNAKGCGRVYRVRGR